MASSQRCFEEKKEKKQQLTKDSPGRDRFSVEPERHLGEDNCHDAG